MFELIYTSYPRGLQSGTSGFTSVAYTKGMPKNYIQLCESLSGYQFVYPLGHPMYELNPEIYSHYRFKIEKEEVSILSRIAVSGKDYTRRENKIAHHIVLDDQDRLRCNEGPAWAMLHGNLFIQHWNQNPCLLSSRNVGDKLLVGDHLLVGDKLSVGDHLLADDPLLTADKFLTGDHLLVGDKLLTGDPLLVGDKLLAGDGATILADSAAILADSAAILAKSAEQYPNIPSFILFDPLKHRTLCLSLIAEALRLVPSENRWNITFNTHFISKPIDSDTLWRCCPTEIHTQKYTDSVYSKSVYSKSVVIDLCQKTIQEKITDQKKITDNNLDETDNNLDEINSLSDKEPLPNSDYFSQADKSSLVENYDEQESLSIKTSLSVKTSLSIQEPLSSLAVGKNTLLLILLSFLIIGTTVLLIIFSNHTDKTQSNHTIQNNTKIIQTNQTNTNAIPNNTLPTNEKKMVLSFYENGVNGVQIASALNGVNGAQIANGVNGDFENMECRLIGNDGMEIDVDIEKPIINDTPNWDIVSKSSKQSMNAQPIGNISVKALSLYNQDLYSGIYFDKYFIWVGPVKIVPPMLSKMISKGSEPNTLEVRFLSEMSNLLPSFLSLLSSENLTAVIELKQNDDNSKPASSKSEDTASSKPEETTSSKPEETISSKPEETTSLKPEKTTSLHPVCSLKRDINGSGVNENSSFIQLKFTAEEFILIKESHLFKEKHPFKEFRIDYKNSPNNKTYSILCLSCK